MFWGHTVKFFAKKLCDGVGLVAGFVSRGAAVVDLAGMCSLLPVRCFTQLVDRCRSGRRVRVSGGAAVVSCSTDASDCKWSVYLPLFLSLLCNDLSGHFDADDEGEAYDSDNEDHRTLKHQESAYLY